MEFFQYGWPIAILLIGFLAKWMIGRVEKDLQDYKTLVHSLEKELNEVKLNYVHTNEMEKIRTELMAKLDKLETIIMELVRK